MFTLIIEDKDGAIADEYSFEEGEFIIGRSHSSDIILPSDNVSRRHARLYTESGSCFIEDLNSSNGVFVNGKRIHRVYEIVRSAQIKVGDYYLHVEGTSYGRDQGPERDVEVQQGRQAASEMGVEESAPAADGSVFGRLIGTNLSTQGKVFDVTRPVTLVGRGKDCAVTVIDQSVSRIHAKVLRQPDGSLRVEDLRSSNGSYVNDHRVTNEPFGHGDKVRFGNVEFVCELPGLAEPEVVEVSSGGRKGLIFLIVFLVLALIGTGVTLFLLRDRIFGAEEAVADSEAVDPEEAEKERKKRDEEKAEQFKEAERRIKRIMKRAKIKASKDKWSDAQRQLVKGAKELERVGALDEKGEMTAWWEAEEAKLRADRANYEAFIDSLDEEEWKSAGRVYKKLAKTNGVFKKLASKKMKGPKDGLLAKAEALCAHNVFDKCLDKYQQAKALDPTDKIIAKKVAKIRSKLSSKDEDKDDEDDDRDEKKDD